MFVQRHQYPTFSSTVLEKIYNSIDEGYGRTPKLEELAFYGEAEMGKKAAYKNLHEACLLDRSLIEKRVRERIILQRRQLYEEMELKPRNHRNFDPDALCFSTSSCSSESSSCGFSSSESDYVVGVKTQASCFTRLRLKPVRTQARERAEKTERPLFPEHSSPKQGNESGSNGVIRSKALKIFEQLKKTKQPISPGGRLVNFINSFFSSSASTTNSDRTARKKTGHSHPQDDEANLKRKMNSSQASSTCSSAPSLSRSCLTKHSSSTKERNGTRRTVRFHPVDVIINEHCEPKCLHEEEGPGGRGDSPGLMPVSVLKASTIGRRTQSGRETQDRPASGQLMENILRDRVGEPEEGFVKDYPRNQTVVLHAKRPGISDQVSKYEDHRHDDNDDDVISCSSSDLFELPVYETTRVHLNRRI